MVCVSNLSFKQVAGTKYIRKSLVKDFPGRIIPMDNGGISAAMMKFFQHAEFKTKDLIQKLKVEGKKFSATLDEWTSAANCRYLNINLHYTVNEDGKTSFINLGLVKISGSCPAPVMAEMVNFRNKVRMVLT